MKRVITHNTVLWTAATLIALIFTQCSDEVYDRFGLNDGRIRFTVTGAESWQDDTETRAAAVTSLYDDKSLIYAWAVTNDESPTSSIYINGGTLVKSGDTYIPENGDYFWPGEDYSMKFFALSPVDLKSNVKTLNTDKITMSYTVPEEPTEQRDLLYCVASSTGDNSAPLEMKYHHLLTAVKIKVKYIVTKASIKSVAINNVYYTGTMTYTRTNSKPSWAANTSKKMNFKREFTGDENCLESSDNLVSGTLIDGEYTFMMLPQSFTSTSKNNDAELEIVLTDGTTIKKNLIDIVDSKNKTVNWTLDKMITYVISVDEETEPVFEVPELISVSGYGTESTESLESYQLFRVNTDRQDFLDCEILSKPDWLTIGEISSNGEFTLTPTVNTDGSLNGDEWIRSQTELTATKDLSNNLAETANCYIVNCAGTYKFPLVYGNAIKNGAANTNAYSNSDGSNGANTYVNHLGNSITSPYIYKNDNCTPASAELLWQDRRGLISSVGLSDNDTYITFTIPKTEGGYDSDRNAYGLGQGNALIAVKDADGNIMWSWHIWVTFYVPGQAWDDSFQWDDWKDKKLYTRRYDYNFERESYTIMPINLGWYDNYKYYPAREGYIKVRQTKTGAEKSIKVVQRPRMERDNYYGGQTYYQWFRKDPFYPAAPYDMVDEYIDLTSTKARVPVKNKSAYDINGNRVNDEYATDTESFKTSKYVKSNIATSIKKPVTFNGGETNSSSWYDTYTKLWKRNTKTIYDPSPAGYTIANEEVFSSASTVTYCNKTDQLNNSGFCDGSDEGISHKKATTSQVNTPFIYSSVDNLGRDSRNNDVDRVNGWEFYSRPKKNTVATTNAKGTKTYRYGGTFDSSGGTYFMPIALYREGSHENVKEDGNKASTVIYTKGTFHGSGGYWVIPDLKIPSSACTFCFVPCGNNIYNISGGYTTHARAIRCMREE